MEKELERDLEGLLNAYTGVYRMAEKHLPHALEFEFSQVAGDFDEAYWWLSHDQGSMEAIGQLASAFCAMCSMVPTDLPEAQEYKYLLSVATFNLAIFALRRYFYSTDEED